MKMPFVHRKSRAQRAMSAALAVATAARVALKRRAL